MVISKMWLPPILYSRCHFAYASIKTRSFVHRVRNSSGHVGMCCATRAWRWSCGECCWWPSSRLIAPLVSLVYQKPSLGRGAQSLQEQERNGSSLSCLSLSSHQAIRSVSCGRVHRFTPWRRSINSTVYYSTTISTPRTISPLISDSPRLVSTPQHYHPCRHDTERMAGRLEDTCIPSKSSRSFVRGHT